MHSRIDTGGRYQKLLLVLVAILAGAFLLQAGFVQSAAAGDGSIESTAAQTTNDQYEPNDDFDSAASISEGTYTDLQVVDGEDDFFAVSVTAGDSIEASISFAHTTGDLDLEVYGPDEQPIDSSASITDGETVSANNVAQTGTYYVHVYGFGGDSASYDLDVDISESSFTGNDEYEPNDDFDSASFISDGIYPDLQIEEGESDYFAVSVDAGQTIESSIDFDHDVGDLDMRLYGPDRQQLESSTSTTDEEFVSASPVSESGTYYIEVYGFAGASAPYDLNVGVSGSGDDSNDQYEPNDEFASAAAISPGTYTDLQVASGDDDYYAVSVEAGETIESSIDFAHATGDLDLELYGPDQSSLDFSISLTDGESVSATNVEQSGTYFIQVYGAGDDSAPYDLTVDVSGSDDPPTDGGSNDEYEPNNDFDSAAFISEGTFSDLQVVEGESDYYAVSANAGDSIESSINFDHDVGDLDMSLYGPDRQELESSTSTTDDEFVSASQVSESGTYYIEVHGFVGASAPYDLDITIDEGSSDVSNDEYEPNNEFDSAAGISAGTYSDLQVVEGESDYYAVTLDEGGSIDASIDFAHSNGDLDLGLYGPDREELDSSTSLSDGESVSATDVTQGGTYYVEVYGFFGEGAPYDLEVTTEGGAQVVGQIDASVVGGNDEPVSGATVRVEDQSGTVVVETTTGDSGEDSFEVQPGEYTVIVEYEGEETQSAGIMVDSDSTESVELVLEGVEGQGRNETDSDGDSDGFAPGFGMGAALVALLSVALLGSRRFVE